MDKGHVVAYDPGSRLGRGFSLRGLIPRRRLLPVPAAAWRRLINAKVKGSAVVRKIPVLIEDQSVPPVLSNTQPFLSFHWGYWQSLDYFFESKGRVQEELARWLELPPAPRDECAVHVRRGDYVSDSGAAAVMGVLPLSYYAQAIEHMKSIGYKDFVVYSDDRPWVVEHLQVMDPAIRVADTSDTEDFLHMASSKALVTANSSFSWWAGFLVESRGGDVLSPKAWFADPQMDSSRLIPETWMTL